METELSAPSGAEAGIEAGAEAGTEEIRTPEYETVAKEKGWRPKEEYEGDLEAWVGAEEFVKRQPLFDKIKVQSKKLKELERTVEALAKHYQTNIQQAKERAISDLKAERREAIELGEVSKVEQIDEKIAHVSGMPEPDIQPKGLAPEIEQFVADQKDWFNKDDEMTSFAVAYNTNYLQRHPGDLGKSLEETLKAVKKAFPDYWKNLKRTAPPNVEGATPSSKEGGKYSYSRLNAEQKLVYDQIVKRHKQMSHEEYFKSLDEAGFLES